MVMPFASAALTWIALALAPAHATNKANAIELGVFPYLSARALLDVYEPVRAYLQAELRRPVNLYTAASFKDYADRTQGGEYDLLVTPPHLARLAQRESGYIPLTVYTRELRGVVVVPLKSPYHVLSELKGKRIATPSKLAVVTIMGTQFLRDNVIGIEENRFHDVGSHSNAVLAVQNNEAEAAITENAALQQMPEALRNSVRIIAQTQRLPHVMYMAHPRLGRESADQISMTLLQFANTSQGRAFLKTSGFEGMRTVEEADLRIVDPFIKELKRLLGTSHP